MPKRLNARSPSLTSQESYSAVIIADLVAEVQQHPENERRSSAKVKEETNLGYDGDKVAGPAAVVTVDSMETIHLKESRTNGADLSKGVILNALQFDTKLNTEVGKPIQINSLSVQTDVPPKEKPDDLKTNFCEMSGLRKLVFGISFLPSVMFVLCFAIILPCDKYLPCVEEQWFLTLNDTEVTSQLKVPQNIIFNFVNEDGAGVRSLKESSGDILWEQKLNFSSHYIECGNLEKSNSESCLMMDDNGTLYLFDPSNGKVLRKTRTGKIEVPTPPLILPDCNNDGTDEVAVAISKSEIIVSFFGSQRSLKVPGCDFLPSQLLTWKKENGTDLILICQKGESEYLLTIPQNKWCEKRESQNETKVLRLYSTKTGILSHSKLLLTTEELFLWSTDDIRMFNADGQLQWSVPSHNHSSQNRFLFYGKFSKEKPQVVLFSSDIWTNFQITWLNPENGNVMKSTTVPNTELSEAVLIHGEEHDFVLALKKKFTKNLKNKAINKINGMSASVINMLTKEEIEVSTLNTSSTLTEEVTFMKLDGSDIQTIQSQTVPFSKGESYTSAFTVIPGGKKETKLLRVFILQRPVSNLMEKLTTLKSFHISNWDMSSEKAAHCVWK